MSDDISRHLSNRHREMKLRNVMCQRAVSVVVVVVVVVVAELRWRLRKEGRVGVG